MQQLKLLTQTLILKKENEQDETNKDKNSNQVVKENIIIDQVEIKNEKEIEKLKKKKKDLGATCQGQNRKF